MQRTVTWLFGFIPLLVTTRRLTVSDELYDIMAERFKKEVDEALAQRKTSR